MMLKLINPIESNKYKRITPKKAAKLAKMVIVQPTSIDDIYRDIYLRAERGHTWTMMIKVSDDLIFKLENEGWIVQRINKNEISNTYHIKISWDV